MPQTVFVSHAGPDTSIAAQVAAALTAESIAVRYDRNDLVLGESFLAFMEEALATSDYCLLLWSQHTAAARWVELEWESALYRSVQEKRAFLVAARLDTTPLPALLRPRLRADLFPDVQPGLSTIIGTWRTDKAVAEDTGRLVGAPRSSLVEPTGPDEIYVTSELFGIATPWKVDLDKPAAALLTQVLARLALPQQVDHEGRIGLRLTYRLMHAGQPLDAHLGLRAQGVQASGVVWLEASVTPFAASEPSQGGLQTVRFRGASQQAAELLAAVRRAGVGLS
jgi:hypothetical protein